MEFNQSILKGNGISLEPVNLGHLGGLQSAATAPDIWSYIPFALSDPAMMELFVTHVTSLPEKGEGQAYAIRSTQTNEIIGGTGYWHIDQQNNKLEIGGSWINPKFQRSSVNTETKYLMLTNAFEKLGCNRVAFSIDMRNTKSVKAIERIGATREGVLRSDMQMHDGTLRDSVIYSIIKSEWPDTKLHIEALLSKYS
jgi:RimJ/RimL family protein N-acetyltransferase